MKYTVDYKNGVICLPGRLAGQLSDIGGNELKVYTYICGRQGSDIDPAELSAALKMPPVAIDSAIAYLTGTGLLTCEGGRQGVKARQSVSENGNAVLTLTTSDSPHYTGREIETLFQSDPGLRGFVSECERILERMFTSHDMNKLIALRQYQGLEAEYIILLCGYLKNKGKGTVPQVDSLARNMISQGITTVSALEEKIAYMRKYDSTEGLVRKLCGVGSRALTTKEKKFIDKWTELGVSEEIIEIAYEITINNTGSPSLPYVNKVIMNWQDAGYRTKEEVFAGIESYRKKKESAKEEKQSGSFETDEFFEAALKRALNKHRGESKPEKNQTAGETAENGKPKKAKG